MAPVRPAFSSSPQLGQRLSTAKCVSTWVTDMNGDPVFMVVADPSASLTGELKGLLPSCARSWRMGGG